MLAHRENVGDLDRRITLQRAIFEVDPVSNQHKITAWETIARTWAKVDESSGAEVNQADQLVGIRNTTFTIRHRTDITIQNRIVYNGENYDIQVMLEEGRKRFLKLTTIGGGQYV